MMNKKPVLLFITSFLVTLFVSAQSSSDDNAQFSIYGFGRTNFVWDNRDLGRSDLFMPANIKINSPKEPAFFIVARQTRLGFNVKTPVGNEQLSIKLEGDFHNDATDANGFFRMRHALASYKFVLVGMTWSNFYSDEVNPTTVDFEGPNSSTISRAPQIRFSTYKSKNELSLSFENPLEKITGGDSISVLPERFPDIIGAYRVNGKFGFVKAAALLRELRYQSNKARSIVGYGVTVMAVIHAGKKDKLMFQAVTGTGVAQYIKGVSGLNYDAIYNGTNELEALQIWGTNISFQHFWKDHLYSTLTTGLINVEDNTNLKAGNFQSGYYGALNIFWEPIKNFNFGWEVVAGERVNINGDKGSAVRLQMNATYRFSKLMK